MQPIRVAVVTISDGVVAGTREDVSGDTISDWAAQRGHSVRVRYQVTDDTAEIVRVLLTCADQEQADVVLTTGGTGLTRRDCTPEATRSVIERDAPGIAEAIRAYGAAQTPNAALSRGLAGTRGSTLIVNLPGSAAAVRDSLHVLDQFLPHAVQLLRGIDTQAHPGHG